MRDPVEGPIAFGDLGFAAARDEPAAMFGDGVRGLGGMTRIHIGVVHDQIGNDISGRLMSPGKSSACRYRRRRFEPQGGRPCFGDRAAQQNNRQDAAERNGQGGERRIGQ